MTKADKCHAASCPDCITSHTARVTDYCLKAQVSVEKIDLCPRWKIEYVNIKEYKKEEIK